MKLVNSPLVIILMMILHSTVILQTGCSKTPMLTESEMNQRYSVVAELRHKINAANEMDNLQYLAPLNFTAAEEDYRKAVGMASVGDDKAEAYARQGLRKLNSAHTSAKQSKELLEEVLMARTRALAAGALQYKAAQINSADKELKKLASQIEKGNIDKAKAGRTFLKTRYESIELEALKVDTVDRAQQTITQAEKNNVDDIAQKTLSLAKEEYSLALSTLDVDRRQKDKAEAHAKLSLWHSQRATEIADIIRHFKNSDFTEEDKVLWYQQQVAQIVAPIVSSVPFNLANKDLVKKLNAELQGTVSEILALQEEKISLLESLEKTAATSEQTQQLCEQQFLSMKTESEMDNYRRQQLSEKFKSIQAMFTPEEADVYRQVNNVLIRAHGFNFPSGSSEIESNNYALINKIISAIKKFQNPNVVVSGHTDNRGNEQINVKLSEERARKVAKFLNEVGNIDANKITTVGFGKQKPVANNDTKEGRIANRRVEILIINEDS